jgi:SAM-dependent methyltransferase
VLGVAIAQGIVVADGDRYRIADGVAPVLCGPMRATFIGEIRSHLMQPVALLDSATASIASTAWTHIDPRILQAQGDASSVLPAVIKMALAPMLGDLVARLDKPGAKLLDVGTGVGALAIAACKTFPQIHVVGLDPSAAALELAHANIARAGLADRIELRQLVVEQLRDEAAYACAWLPAFFIAPDLVPAAITRVTAALEPGGWMLMAIPGAGDDEQRAVNELVGAVWGGPTVATAVAEEWLRDAGLREVRTLPGPAWAQQMIAGVR